MISTNLRVIRRLFLVCFLVCSTVELFHAQVLLHPNRGQWDDRILYKSELVAGELIVEKKGFTYNLFDYDHPHHHIETEVDHQHDRFIQHVVKSSFIDALNPESIVEKSKVDYYRNYFLGSDSTRWKSKVHSVQSIELSQVYPGISWLIEGRHTDLKYSFIIAPNADPSQIKMRIEGASSLNIDESGDFVIRTKLGEIREAGLVAWVVDSLGRKTNVDCRFRLNENVLSFELGDYDTSKSLIIDPILTFSTFTGSTTDNWGFTACPDLDGNLFAGGIDFGTGYPVTAGVYDGAFNGGHPTTTAGGGSIAGFDITLTKFSPDGTQNLYSTYIGGSGNETPNSIVTNDVGELFVLGITSSTNFPVTGGAYQTTFAGGPSTTQYLLFNGSDLVLFRLSADGSSMLASTYLGGSGNDGLNYGSNLLYNYGDAFRGEIIVDEVSNVYFSSTTRSNNFPNASTNGALSGSQDAVYGRMNAALTTLDFARYYGGTGFESGNSIQRSSAGDLYMTGGTTSSNLNFGAGGFMTNTIAGTDAYVILMDGATGAVSNGSILGTSQYDQGYFVQLDLDNNVYVMGQSAGNYPNIGGVYGNPNSGQFIHKLNQNLTSSIWSTTIGASSGNVEISPTAFLVSDCYDIYISGWGGQTNASNSLATSSSSNGFPVTSDAYQTTTNGSNFYLAVLAQDAEYLKYATYMGGANSSFNHVDGGTSRFDKSGTIYHAVCGSCGSTNNGFTTTPGVWSPTSLSNNCNLAAFKFELSVMTATIGNTQPFICYPNPVVFENNSSNGNTFFWDFGDGNTSNEINPTHNYAGPGNYQVTLVVSDTNNCFSTDTAYFDIEILLFEGEAEASSSIVCPGTTVFLSASGGTNYQWSPAALMNDSTIPNPEVVMEETTLFQVIVSDSCGADTLSVLVEVFEANLDIFGDTVLCRGDSTIIDVSLDNMISFEWTASDESVIIQTIPTTISPYNSMTISFEGVTADGCDVLGELSIHVDTLAPILELVDTVGVCRGDAVSISVSGATSYEWFPAVNITPTTGSQVSVSPAESMTYYVNGYNSCGMTPDSVFVEVIQVFPIAGNDTIICPGEIAFLWADGGVGYSWSPAGFAYTPNAMNTIVQPTVPTRFVVTVKDENGCSDTTGVFVDLFPPAFVQTSPDYYGFPGDPIQISANGVGNGDYTWSPVEYLSCPNCQETSVYSPETITYTVTFVNDNGCIARDDVTIHFDAIIYVPNTFTPDGNNFNPVFKPEGGNIVDYNLKIFNRWGELIFESNNFNIGWDGTYGGMLSPDGTYIWVIEYSDSSLIPNRIKGHVNLLR